MAPGLPNLLRKASENMLRRKPETIAFDERQCEREVDSRLDSPTVALDNLFAVSPLHAQYYQNDRQRGLDFIASKIKLTRTLVLRRAKVNWTVYGDILVPSYLTQKEIQAMPDASRGAAQITLYDLAGKQYRTCVHLAFHQVAKEANFGYVIGFDVAKYRDPSPA